MRRSINADKRVSWEEFFFKNTFQETLSKEDAGEYEYSLEMLRLAPSAVNKQPWRVVMDDRGFHFFEKKMPEIEVPKDTTYIVSWLYS